MAFNCKTEGCKNDIWRTYGSRCRDHVNEYIRKDKEKWELLNKYDLAERDGMLYWKCRTCTRKRMDINLNNKGQCSDCHFDDVRKEYDAEQKEKKKLAKRKKK